MNLVINLLGHQDCRLYSHVITYLKRMVIELFAIEDLTKDHLGIVSERKSLGS
jgi:hypothetical protein